SMVIFLVVKAKEGWPLARPDAYEKPEAGEQRRSRDRKGPSGALARCVSSSINQRGNGETPDRARQNAGAAPRLLEARKPFHGGAGGRAREGKATIDEGQNFGGPGHWRSRLDWLEGAAQLQVALQPATNEVIA